uniref:Uncharacterized protein n=1 Tax=Anguilla anguilla TaxID=7936 RepID=A0A0E9UHY8_ANGAN
MLLVICITDGTMR